MRFGAPIWLAVLPFLGGGLLALGGWAWRRARRDLAGHFGSPLLPRLLHSVDSRRRGAKLALLVAGVLALGFALARPQWGQREVEIEQTGIDLIVALDVSRSMLAADAGGTNRLAVAINALEHLLGALGGDRAGLVVFAGEAFAAVPLTRDHTVIERALRSHTVGTVTAPGSNLGEAVHLALKTFDAGVTGPRLLLVVSDGEQLQGDAVEAARMARAAGLRVHTAGVGSAAGARVPAPSWGTGGFARNPLGREVVSRLDEQGLRRIAAAGGGVYTRLEARDGAGLAGWFRQAASGLPRTTAKRALDEPRERFQWALAGALTLLSAEWLTGDRRRGRRRERMGRRVVGAEGGEVVA